MSVFLGWMPEPRAWLDGPLTGWTHIGLEHKMSHQPPFGFYDKEAK